MTAIIDDSFLSQSVSRAYYSEASVQMKLGIELWRRLGCEPELERLHSESGGYIDILVNCKGVRYGIELKYKTKREPGFHFKQQGAQDHGRYDFLKDVSRIEAFVKAGFIDVGFSCFLTNDPNYWKQLRDTSYAKPFQLTDGTTLSGAYTPRWKHRTKAITLAQRYSIRWMSASKPRHGEASFKALLVSCS